MNESYVKNCDVIMSEKDRQAGLPALVSSIDDVVTVTIDGYYIVPKDEYDIVKKDK